MKQNIAFEVHIDQPYELAVESVTQALKAEGFGILASIDVRTILKVKLGEDFRPYVILEACNPPLAHRALSTDGRAGLMLPCPVTVEAVEQGGSLVRIANPEVMLTVGPFEDNPVLQEVASQARARLERVAHALASS
jgi:uncharacterized protein (DUF302 family)